jgi:hypothetical protein
MAPDQLALIVSIVSVVIASLALGWNVYRDVILKPKVVVSVAVVAVIHETLPHRPQYLNITATNFGPGVVTLSSIHVKNSTLWRRILRKVQYAYITPDYTNPMSGRLPAKLETGDKVELLLPYDANCLLGREFTHVGLTDFYSRTHWTSRRAMKQVCATWKEDFETNT